MFGTRIILMGLTSDPENSSADDAEAEVLCAANHQIPAFWLLLFNSSHIRFYKLPENSELSIGPEAGTEYPVLIGTKESMLQTLSLRITQLAPWLSAEDKELLNEWQSFIAEQTFPVIAMDTYELWSTMQNPERLCTQIKEQLTVLETIDKESGTSIFNTIKESTQWQEGDRITLSGFGW